MSFYQRFLNWLYTEQPIKKNGPLITIKNTKEKSVSLLSTKEKMQSPKALSNKSKTNSIGQESGEHKNVG